ncbi:DUF6310 domain-containing protein [Stigmatella aurantiaca]|uniref:DUF6310 domain-containing protein n=1 Tax=Stigmatella aurantiaca (strain DW4/3-1) TaxID=378806 RepID=Q08R40_STIAD|nr:DUF6310 domain-containing protein [Stigmatella aurantiaca]ADO69788.1 uncharacterized protein STAUR_1984 [Stigmatella aurantiaca DW4/3-1]EAU62948.1 hypothetical protein STIAU_2375 [Stigmatella aurantiaca DW4/3-1]
MPRRTCSAPLLLLLLSACTTMDPSPGEFEAPSPRLANLQRAALYPWTDDGQCVVREASNEWPILAERCFYALERDRMRFRDVTKKCAVAQADAAAPAVVALCIFAAPEIVAGAVIVVGAVVVAAAIQEGIDAYQRHAARERAKLKTQPTPAKEPLANQTPKPKGSPTGDIFPVPDSNPRRPECEAIPVPRASKDDPHNECADKFPPNRYPGMDVSVGGIRFDALQVGVRVLWEIKTHQFDKYNSFVQSMEIDKELKQIQRERAIATACGYDFVIGVSTQAHKDALLAKAPLLNIVVTGCTR